MTPRAALNHSAYFCHIFCSDVTRDLVIRGPTAPRFSSPHSPRFLRSPLCESKKGTNITLNPGGLHALNDRP